MESNKSAVSDLQGGLYLPPSWQALRQQIAYLAQFGGSLQVVQGRLGAGKTTLLNWLQDEPICGDFIVVGAELGQDVGAFLFDLLWQLGLRPEQGAPLGEHIAGLRGYVQSLHQEGERVVVAVDDAHWISEAALAAIVSVLQGGGSTGLGLHLILFSEPGLPEKLDRLQLLDVELHDATIPTLGQSEVEQFLYARGMALVSGLEPETARQIWYRSKGIPGLVLKEFEAIGEESSSASEPRDDSVNWWSLPLGHLAAVAVLIAVLMWAYFGRSSGDMPGNESLDTAQKEISSDLSSLPVTTTMTAQLKPLQENQSKTAGESASFRVAERVGESLSIRSAESVVASAPVVGDMPAYDQAYDKKTIFSANASKTTQLGSEIETETEEKTQLHEPAEQAAGEDVLEVEMSEVEKSQVEGNEVEASANRPNLVAKSQNATADTDLGSPIKAAQVKDNDRQSETQASSKAIRSTKLAPQNELQGVESSEAGGKGESDSLRYQYAEQQLTTLPDSGFVIQLMALSDYKKLQAFARSQPNSKSLMIYRAQRNGKLLYILVEGFYADKESAASAVINLPPSQRKGKPWPKQISAIKRDIAQLR